MRNAYTPQTSKLLENNSPSRTAEGYAKNQEMYVVEPGHGTGKDFAAPITHRVGFWNARFRRWRDGFEQRIGPNARAYWQLYRSFDQGPLPGPQQDWRDRTVIPESFKIIETRVPRLVAGLWAKPENFTTEGRGFRDEQYEEKVRVLLQTLLDEVGKGSATAEPFLKRMMDSERYKQVVGHVWLRVSWKTLWDYVRTRVPKLDQEGNVNEWAPVEFSEQVYDGIDVQWLPLDSVAVDLGGQGFERRWIIERFQTSWESLKAENEKYKRIHKRDLYKNLEALGNSIEPAVTRESYEEPRDTEHWPLTDDQITDDPGESKVEMWLCWDNLEGTLTKIANRSYELDHGLMPTPDRRDPYIGCPAIPIPGRVYGESILHYTGPLSQYQTRIARARADEVMLNIWQQYLYREGSIRSAQWFWRPGGGMGIETSDPDKPVDNDVKLLQRRPVFQESYTEESYRQQQAEATAGADAISQGVEATSKSRDVSATEVNQRAMQGASRYEMEILYNKVSVQKVLLQKIFDLARANLTQPKVLRILDDHADGPEISLEDLDRPIDIVVGPGVQEATAQERVNELRELKELGESPAYGPYVKHGEVLRAMVKASRTLNKNVARFVKTKEEVQGEQQQQMAQQMAAQGALPPAGGGESTPLPQPATMDAGGGPGPAGLLSPSGQSPEAPPAESGPKTIDI